MDADESRLVDLRVHPGHRGFLTGGRRGSIVVRVIGGPGSRVLIETDEARDAHTLIKQGWRALACDGLRLSGEELLRAAGLARREGRDCLVTFEVDAETARCLGRHLLRRQLARRQLQDALGNRSLRQLGLLTAGERAEYVRSLRVQWLVVDASAVFEVEVLLGTASGGMMQQAKDLFTAVKRGNAAAIREIIESDGFASEALRQRDGGGNLPIHHAPDLEVARLLVEPDPSTRAFRNAHGQLPVHTYLMRRSDEEFEAVELLAESDRDFLRLDEHGVSPAMILQGPGRKALENRLAAWTAMAAALEGEVSAMHSMLEELSSVGTWAEIFAFHCFGEKHLLDKKTHTPRSRARLLTFWAALQRVLQAAATHDQMAMPLLRELLLASKGPRLSRFDPREPYRVGLVQALRRLKSDNRAAMADVCKTLDCDSVQRLRSQPDYKADDLVSMDIGLCFRVPAPQWLTDHDLRLVYEDLRQVGSIGAFNSRDGIYEMLQLADAESHQVNVTEDDCFLARWFAAWLRGLCQGHQGQVVSRIREILGPTAEQPSSFFARAEAKAFSRICEQVAELAACNNFRDRGPKFLRQAAAFVTDINACTYVAESIQDLHVALAAIEAAMTAGQLNIRKIENGFRMLSSEGLPAGDKPSSSYAEHYGLRLWVELEDSMLVELQLELRCLSEMSRCHKMHLNVLRGRFDWSHLAPHVRGLWSDTEAMEAAEKQRREEEERLRLEEELARAEAEEEAERQRLREEEEQRRLRCKQIEQCKSQGMSVAELRASGFTDQEMSLTASSMKDRGVTREAMDEAGWPLSELKLLDYRPSVLKLLFDHEIWELKRAGFSAADLLGDPGTCFSASHMRQAGFSAKDLFEAGADRLTLKGAGFSAEELNRAGVML